MKKNFALIKIMLVASAAATLCACGKQPVAVEEPPVEAVEETVVEEPEPEKPEPEEVEEPEMVEEHVEEELPSVVLYDENGDFYKPQAVTLKEIYERIDYANEKYDWKSEWDRDRFVSILLYENALYMQDSDIKTIYYDYLDNYGLNVLLEDNMPLEFREDGIRTLIDPEDFYIDQVEAAEIKKYRLAYEQGKLEQLAMAKKEELINLDNKQKDLYTTSFMDEFDFLSGIGKNYEIACSHKNEEIQKWIELQNKFIYNNFEDEDYENLEDYTPSIYIFNCMRLKKIQEQLDTDEYGYKYNIEDYKSSHEEN